MDIIKKRDNTQQKNSQDSQKSQTSTEVQLNNKEVNKEPVKKEEELEETRIKKIDLLSFGITLGLINFIFGFICGLFIFISSYFGLDFGLQVQNIEFLTFLLGFGSIFVLPIIFGFLGFFQGIFVALLYNLVSRISKGVKLYGV